MTAEGRRLEIMRILRSKRQTTGPDLATTFQVSIRTIWRDIDVLTGEFPIETLRGHGGGIRLADSYHPYRHSLNQEEEKFLLDMLSMCNEAQRKILQGLLVKFGSSVVQTKLASAVISALYMKQA